MMILLTAYRQMMAARFQRGGQKPSPAIVWSFFTLTVAANRAKDRSFVKGLISSATRLNSSLGVRFEINLVHFGLTEFYVPLTHQPVRFGSRVIY
ncbi:MAG: hypothetical protein B7Z34_02665 [Novosphingobium sp. 12-62-10]|nr:MAG: hypothetical protein B7Z34_02665 [Novosphingobium sp. 12-62-10]